MTVVASTMVAAAGAAGATGRTKIRNWKAPKPVPFCICDVPSDYVNGQRVYN
jgi:hypothetical protein